MKTEELTASVTKVSQEVAKFDKIFAGLAELEKAYPIDVACDVRSTTGMKHAITGRAAWRGPRISVEKARQAAKAPILKLGKEIDAFAKDLEHQLLMGESHYDGQIKAEEKRKENERKSNAEAESLRIEKHVLRINLIRNYVSASVGNKAEVISRSIAALEAYECGSFYEEYQEQAKTAKVETMARLCEMHAAAIASEIAAARIKSQQEAEAARLAKEREELDRLRLEQQKRDAEERELLAEATRIANAKLSEERERLAQETRIENAKLAEERAALEKELAEVRAQKQLIANEEAAKAQQKRIEEEAEAMRIEKAAQEKILMAEAAAMPVLETEKREDQDQKSSCRKAFEKTSFNSQEIDHPFAIWQAAWSACMAHCGIKELDIVEIGLSGGRQ